MIFKPQSFHGEAPAVASENPPEASLEQKVADALAVSDATGSLDLRVVASGGEILLLGNVTSTAQMDRIVDVVLNVPGVEKVTLRASTHEAP